MLSMGFLQFLGAWTAIAILLLFALFFCGGGLLMFSTCGVTGIELSGALAQSTVSLCHLGSVLALVIGFAIFVGAMYTGRKYLGHHY